MYFKRHRIRPRRQFDDLSECICPNVGICTYVCRLNYISSIVQLSCNRLTALYISAHIFSAALLLASLPQRWFMLLRAVCVSFNLEVDKSAAEMIFITIITQMRRYVDKAIALCVTIRWANRIQVFCSVLQIATFRKLCTCIHMYVHIIHMYVCS